MEVRADSECEGWVSEGICVPGVWVGWRCGALGWVKWPA